jgi:diguanylate cyclase (GGDEF)-like protein
MPRGHQLPLEYHRILLDDFHRVDTYDRAIRALVRPGDVVLDVGTGTGLLALLAARRGARVHAVESMPVARLARALAERNGFADRITVHEADLVELAPVEPVDLVLGEFIGRFLVDDRMLDAVEAAGRWLKPGGRCCPSRVTLRVAPVGNIPVPPVDLWRHRLLGLDLEVAARWAESGTTFAELPAGALLADPADWHRWEPPGLPAPFVGDLHFRIGRRARFSGLLGFFDALLAPGVKLSSGPGSTTHWGQVLFHGPPLSLEPGDELAVHLEMLPGEDLDFRWNVRQLRSGVEIDAFEAQTGPPAPIATQVALPPAGSAPALAERARAWAARGDDLRALAAWEETTRAATPEDDGLAREAWEELGLCYRRAGRSREAVRAFLRALDGALGSRERALRHLVECAVDLGLQFEFDRWASAYEEAFGRHPAGHHPGQAFVPRRSSMRPELSMTRDEPDEDETTMISTAVPAAPVEGGIWLIVLSGRSVGRMFRLEPGEVVIGRSPANAVVLDDEGVSREHARLIVGADRTYRIVDLDSRNGTYVEDQRVGTAATAVREGDRIRLGPATIVKLGMADELERQVMVQLYHAATRDGLTGLFNKRFFFEQLEQEVAWHRRHGHTLSLIVLDVDFFKQVNTNFGHPGGDVVLTELARRLIRTCRAEDILARYGGEEFALILRQTDAAAAAVFGERLRVAIKDRPFALPNSQQLAVTISLGVATRTGDQLRASELLDAADQALLRAKAAGRDRVVVAD